ncbi:hypothetical protein L6164_023323 [Bauhinia variegata]|uniref:Uncharacterized protein n=1 Tax=Bauhinia variegata TaxID=167791 RepID=A0ACB9MJ91_BAUVA|nr:hypothetical protein L6164_023323 [Bauhinia variegata]
MAVALASLGIRMIGVAVILSLIWRVLNWVWFRPKRIEKQLREQGLKGNPYRFLFGDEKEVSRMLQEVKSKPINIDDDIGPRMQPYQYKTVNKYGTKNVFIWMGPTPEVLLLKPEHIKEIFNKYADFPKVTRNPLVKYLFSGIALSEGEKWAKHKRIINPAFHVEKLKLMLPAMHQCGDELIMKWHKIGSDKKSFELDVWPYLNDCTGDVISRTAFGSSVEAGRRIFELLNELKDHTVTLMHSYYIPGMRFLPTKTNQRVNAIEREVHELVRAIIRIREKAKKEGEATRNDLLGLLLESNYNEMQQEGKSEKHGLSINDVVDECKLFYSAGQESVAFLLNWTLVLLSRYPEWQKRAREEVREVFGNKKPTYDELNRLKVVTMILHETLRLYPPSSWLSRAIPQETKLGDLTLPAKSEVWISLLMLQRDPELWGPDAKEFNPERFSEGLLKATQGRVSFIPFGWGPRICIGQHYALQEAKLFMCLMLQNFSFELSPSYVHAPYMVIGITPQYGTKLIIQKL